MGWLQVQNGDIRRDEAHKELNRFLKTGEAFPDLDKIRALRDQWGS